MKLMKDIFSLPINPKGDLNFTKNVFVPFLKRNKHLIYDLYFTCRIPPFSQDAMGDIFENDPVRGTTINALWISEQSGIPLSATFNNMWVRPDQKNLDIWIENFKPLYDKGIRIVTLPHTTWVSTGQIQKEFPELFIKNTILREVTRANEVVAAAKAGFHYVNLDRDLMRDRDALKRIKDAKDYCESIGKPVKISLLANEGCWGGCPIMPEHYQFNCTRSGNGPQYFNDTISRVSCSTWEYEDSSASLKMANLPPWRDDWEEFIDLGIDVFKMHGRESMMRLKESMDIIDKWNSNESILFPQLDPYMKNLDIQDKPIDVWREKIKTCKFDCWECNYCESVVDAHIRKQDRELHPLIDKCLTSIDNATKKESKYNHDIEGLSSDTVKHFLNNLCSYEDTRYLEVGVYNGSTFCAAIQGNDVTAYASDHWEDKNIKPYRDDIPWKGDEGSLDTFISNVKNIWTDNSDIVVMEGDIRGTSEINFNKNVNTIFYDGEHDAATQTQCLEHILKYTDDEFVLVIDDANFKDVVESSKDFIEKNNLKILYERILLTDELEDSSSWWNGIAVFVLKK
tara:strand:- start:2199 stop:3905 length:1707 start_codon:yes stop_codon:yes gene_type:complete